MKIFIITHKATKSEMLFKYSLKGVLIEFKLNFKPKQQFYELLEPEFPFTINQVQAFKNDPKYTVQVTQKTISFKSFWDEFNYKHGDKQRAKKLWDLLTEEQQTKAILYIPTYKSMLINSNRDHLYPETYLKQKRFEND